MHEARRAQVPMAAEVLTSASAIASVEDDWRRLAVRAGSPFLTPEWFAACLAESGGVPIVTVVRGAGGPSGILPLLRERRGMIRILRFAGDGLGDRFGLLVDDGEAADGIAALAGEALRLSGIGWDVVSLAHIDASQGWHEAFARALLPRPAILEWRRVECPEIIIGDDDFDAYMNARSRGTRKEARRRRRRIEEDPTHSFRSAGPAEAREATATLLRLHDLRWDDRGGSSIGSPAARRVLTTFNASAAERGWLRLWELRLDGRPVASELAWRVGARQTHFQGGFDPAESSRAVGIVLFVFALRDAFTAGADEIDLGQGTATYKVQLSTGSRVATTFVVVRASHPLRPVLAAAGVARRRLIALSPERRQAVVSPLRAVRRRLRR